MAVGANVPVSVDSTLSDAGAVTFSSGDQVTVGWDEEIAVSGSLTANSTTFIDGGNTANITFASSGTLSGGGNSFNLPIYVSYTLVASLAGNASLDEVYIEAGTISSGTLSLKLIGNNTSMSYLFASGFTVAAGGTMAVGANVPVSVDSTVSDAGAVTFSSGDQVTVGWDEEIAVSGSLTANSTTFIDGGNTANITFASSGTLSGGGNSFNLPIYVSYTLVASLAGNASLDEVYIEAGTISSGTLSLKLIGNNTSMSYLFASGFTVVAGGTMAVGANVPVSVDSTLSDAGAVSFSSGDEVTVGWDEEIAVSGSLTANSTTFIGGGNTANITFASSATLGGGTDTFNLPIYVPYNLVPSLAVNTNYVNDVYINPGTLPSGKLLSLHQFGTGPALQYVFLSGFTVAAGATLEVGPNASVLIESTLTDGGALGFDTGANVSFSAGEIAVNGIMSATNDTFTNTGGESYIEVNSGGQLNASNSTFALANLILNAGSNAQLAVNSIANEFSINSGATINITGNNFSNISNTTDQNIVASGDPKATINLANNYWGTTNTTQIEAKITDNTDNSNLPMVSYQPALVDCQPGGRGLGDGGHQHVYHIQLLLSDDRPQRHRHQRVHQDQRGQRDVHDPQRHQHHRQARHGQRCERRGQHQQLRPARRDCRRDLHDSGDLLRHGELSRLHRRQPHPDVNAAATTTAAKSTSATYSTVAQSVPLTAAVTSAAGTVNGGTVTFSILNGGTTIATSSSTMLSTATPPAAALRYPPAPQSTLTRSRPCIVARGTSTVPPTGARS